MIQVPVSMGVPEMIALKDFGSDKLVFVRSVLKLWELDEFTYLLCGGFGCKIILSIMLQSAMNENMLSVEMI